jgi:hypothetical protein
MIAFQNTSTQQNFRPFNPLILKGGVAISHSPFDTLRTNGEAIGF